MLLAPNGPSLSGHDPFEETGARICEAISEETRRNKTWLDRKTVVETLNRMMIGWANYFCLGPVSKAYSAVEHHVRRRLRQWLRAKYNLQGRRPRNIRKPPCMTSKALPALPGGRVAFRGRHREPFSESRMREMRLSGSMSGLCQEDEKSSCYTKDEGGPFGAAL